MKRVKIQIDKISLDAAVVVRVSKDEFIKAGQYYTNLPIEKQQVKLAAMYDACQDAVAAQPADAPATADAPSLLPPLPPAGTDDSTGKKNGKKQQQTEPPL